MNTVSIITAFYKGNKFIDRLLSSIQMNYDECKKNGIELESIIVNDSPDCSVNYDKNKYKFKISVICNSKNIGIHGTRINGIFYALGEYIIMLDQDDILTPHAISSQINSLGNCDICVGNGIQVSDVKERIIFKTQKYHRCVKNVDVFLKFGTPIISPGQCLIKKESIPVEWLQNIIHKNGADDEILWILMLLRGYRFCINRADVYHHISTGNNTSDNFEKMADSSLEGITLFDKQGIMTEKQKKDFIRRRTMKKKRYNASKQKKVFVNLRYFDLSLFIMKIKILQMKRK